MAEREVAGHVADGFEPVRDAFRRALVDSPGGGGALSVLVDGSPVVDLWGGSADAPRDLPWVENTTSVFFSMTKGLMALLVTRLVEAGLIDLDAPMTEYWPEFGQAGKESITVRTVMAHRAGLSYPVEDLSREDVLAWDPVITKLERQEPLWEPGSAHQYHAMTYGWLVGELVRRVTGVSVTEAFQSYLSGPLGAEAWIGLPAEQLPHVARLAPAPGFRFELPDEVPNARQLVRALLLGGALPAEVAGDGTGLNDPEIQQAVVPAGLGIGTARALATLWSSAIVATPTTQPVDAGLLDDMTVPRSTGAPLWPMPGAGDESWGTGFHVPSEAMPMLGPSSFGHAGAGGQLAFADRDHRLAFAFLTNDLQLVDRRVPPLIAALHASLAY